MLAGMDGGLRVEEEYTPWVRRVPPRSGLLLGKSCFRALRAPAKELDRPRRLVVAVVDSLLLVETGWVVVWVTEAALER